MAFPRRIQSIVKAYFWQNQVLRAPSNSTEMQSCSNFCSRSHLSCWVMLQRTDLATLTVESQYWGFSPAPVFPKVSMGRCLYSSCLSLCRMTKFSPELNFKLQGGSGFQFQFKKKTLPKCHLDLQFGCVLLLTQSMGLILQWSQNVPCANCLSAPQACIVWDVRWGTQAGQGTRKRIMSPFISQLPRRDS